jgi:hypothetical protein
MPVAVLSLDALTERDLGAWRALAAAAAEPNPFFEPEFVVPAARHLGRDGVGLAVAEAGGEWIGAMPVRRARWKGLPVPAYGAWMHDYCFFGAPLVAAGREEAALGLLLGWLRRRTALVPLEQLPVKGPVAEALTSVLAAAGVKPIVWNTWERAALHRRPENDYIESMLNSKRRRELRRQRKLLGEEHGGEVTGGDMVGDPAILDAFLKLEASGWKGRGGTAMTSAGHDAFLKEACTAFAAAGRLQVMAVLRRHAGGGPVQPDRRLRRLLLQARDRRVIRPLFARRAAPTRQRGRVSRNTRT